MTLRQWLLILLLSAIWGASFLFLRIAVPQAGVLLTTAARLGFASLLLGLVAWYFGHLRGWPLKRKMAILALVNSAIPFGLFSFAAQHLPAGYLAVLNASTPTQGLLIGVLLYKAPHHWKMWGGVVLGFAGVAFLTSMGPVEMGPMQWLGVMAGLGAAFCYAVTAYWTVNWFNDMPSEKLAFQNQFMAFLWLVPGLIAMPVPEIKDVGTIWMALLAAGILCTGVAYLLYFRILQEVGPIPSSSVGFLIPCFAMLWSFLFLNESINVAHLVGLGCIILAVKWIQPVKKVIDLANH